MPPTLPMTIDRIDSNGIYLIDNGETIYLYVLNDVD